MPRRSRALAQAAGDEFDPQAFLAKVGKGKSVSTFRKTASVFSSQQPLLAREPHFMIIEYYPPLSLKVFRF